MSDPSSPLMAALRGTLRVVENIDPEDTSPLSEATANSVNLLLDEINNALADGMPERITDDKLAQLVDIYRAQALAYATEQEEKKTRPRATRQKGNIVDIIL